MNHPIADFEHAPPGLLAMDNMVYFAQTYKENYIKVNTVQSLYNTSCYNTDLDITWSCCGSQIYSNMEFYKRIIGK